MIRSNHVRTAAALLAGALILLAGCTAAKHKGEGRVYNRKNKFSIVPPPGWTSRGEFMGNFMFFTGPQEQGFAVNFNVNAQKDDGTPIESYPAVIKDVLRQVLVAHEVADEGFTEIDGAKCYYISGRFRGAQGMLQNLQYCIRGAKGRVYTITFTAPQEVFDDYRPVFEEVAISARMD